mgnify:CR=1 FL=1
MLLTIKDRLILLGTLANVQGNLTELRILRELREALSFSEKEHKKLNIREEGGRILWKEGEPKEVEIGEVAKRVIVNKLKELNAQGLLSDDHLGIADKFPEVEGA